MIEKENINNEFTLSYIITPIEVFGNEKLSHTDRYLFSFINLLDGKNGCFASNSYLANLMSTSETTISNCISNLLEHGYIKKEGFDGRKRTLSINQDYLKIHKGIKDSFGRKFSKKAKIKSKPPLKISGPRVQENLNPELKKVLTIRSKSSKSNNLMSNNISKDIFDVFSKHNVCVLKLIEFWNKLSSTTKHQINANNKTFKNIYTRLENLLLGIPIETKKDKETLTKCFMNFIDTNNIPKNIYSKKWSAEEIKDMFEIINKDNSKSNNTKKISLKDILWCFNPRSGSGYSVFLNTALDTIIPEKFVILTDNYLNSINKSIPYQIKKQWIKIFYDMVTLDNVDINEINEIIAWYKDNRGNKYIPVCDTVPEFYEKYIKLMQAKKRTEENDSYIPRRRAAKPISYTQEVHTREELNLFENENIKDFLQQIKQATNTWMDSAWGKYTLNEDIIFDSLVKMKSWINNFLGWEGAQWHLNKELGTINQISKLYINWLNGQDWLKNGINTNSSNSFIDPGSKLFGLFINSGLIEGLNGAEIRSRGWGADKDTPMLSPAGVEQERIKAADMEEEKRQKRVEAEKESVVNIFWAVSVIKNTCSDPTEDVLNKLKFQIEQWVGEQTGDWKGSFVAEIKDIEKKHLTNPKGRVFSYFYLMKDIFTI